MRKLLSKGLVVVAALLVAPSAVHPTHRLPDISYRNDPRFLRLQTFFEDRDCPIQDLAADFLAAADNHNLDWRLLPSISVIESSGGKYYRNNNIFGWDNCNKIFPSVRQGIHHVASRLANSNLYKNKDLDGKLRIYNPAQGYPARVKLVMRALDPTTLADTSSFD